MRSQLGPDLVVKSFTRRGGVAWPSCSSRALNVHGCLAGFLLIAVALEPQAGIAKPLQERWLLTSIEEPATLDEGTAPVAGKVLQDTIWIADWSFDGPDGSCNSDGWIAYDNRILNDGTNFWATNNSYSGAGGGTITNNAAILKKHDLCWAYDGYGNNWDYSLICKYSGSTATLAFKFVADTEGGFDFVKVEADSLGLSEARVDYNVDPVGVPSEFREELFSNDGDLTGGVTVAPISLPDFGPGVHEAYIRFIADGAVSPEDGEQTFVLGAAMVIDDIVVTGGTAYTANFDCGAVGCLNPNVQLLNTAVATPFGQWARLYKHLTDNDKCSENTTCAWTWTDPTSIARFPDMAFGPGAAVVRGWLDNIIVSPWVSLASTPSALGTILSLRRFPPNHLHLSGVVHLWRVRGKLKIDNTDTSASGDSVDCMSPWSQGPTFPVLSRFVWVTSTFDVTGRLPPASREVQFSYRVTTWQYLAGAPPPPTFNPGPGPYLDRVRIGRRVLTGPVFDIGLDTRFQGSDNFASTVNTITPGEHHSPSGDRFGTCDFRQGSDQGTNLTSTQIVSGDSVTTNVLDARLAGGITSVRWYGAITAGPHAGRAPAPYIVGASGFFEVTPDSARNSAGVVVANRWSVELDDTYLRGSDALVYFWYATDAQGGASSAPSGITALPASVAAAEAATRGLFEVNCLPAIDWAPEYLARIAADAHGDLSPTPAELASSSQRNCILYYQHTTGNRRSGPLNTTAFMQTLNTLGYEGAYDIYDLQGYGNTNNQLASRAAIAQCTGYQLIIEDDGRSNLSPNIPDGANSDNEKVRQATWYRSWLDAGLTSEAGRATLWILGESTASEFMNPTNPLFASYCGLGAVVPDQALSLNPDVVGQTSFTFAPSSCVASFAGNVFSLNGGCPLVRNYDGFTAAGTAVATHKYRSGMTLGSAAVLMNARPATHANTILMGFAWDDVRSPICATPPGCPSPSTPAKMLAARTLSCVLTPSCQPPQSPSSVPGDDELDVPPVSALHQNVPNPFNPTTMIAFDLAQAGHVRLEVFDVSGRNVRVLVDKDLPAARNHRVVWDGFDAAGARTSSGVYFYRLVAGDLTATRKMIVLK